MTSELDHIPTAITAGDSVSWRLSLPYFPASEGWAISYALVKGDKLITIESAADGDDHLVTLPSATTAEYDPGEYVYQQYATKEGERTTRAMGRIEIIPSFAAATEGFDARTPAEKTLALLEATYDKVAAKALATKSAGGISTTDKELADLREQINQQRALVAIQRRKKAVREGRRPGNKIKVRFT